MTLYIFLTIKRWATPSGVLGWVGLGWIDTCHWQECVKWLVPSLPIKSCFYLCSSVLGRFGCRRLNAESRRNSSGKQVRRRPKCLDFMLWTHQGRGSRIQASVVLAGGAGVSDVGFVNGCWIG